MKILGSKVSLGGSFRRKQHEEDVSVSIPSPSAKSSNEFNHSL